MEKKSAAKDIVNSNNLNNSSGIASVVLGIVSIVNAITFLGSFSGLPLGIIGLIFGIIQAKSNRTKWSTAGIILCILGIIINIIIIALMVTAIIQILNQFQQLQASGSFPTA
jgi:hypothetical protein